MLTDAEVIDPNGQLFAYNSGDADDTLTNDAVTAYLDTIGVKMNTAFDGYNLSYLQQYQPRDGQR